MEGTALNYRSIISPQTMAHQMMLNSITTNIDYLFSDLITRYRLLRAIPHVFKPYRSNPNKPNYTPPLDDDYPTQLNPKAFDTTKLMLLAAVAVGNVFDTPSRNYLMNQVHDVWFIWHEPFILGLFGVYISNSICIHHSRMYRIK
eukprot:727426_1